MLRYKCNKKPTHQDASRVCVERRRINSGINLRLCTDCMIFSPETKMISFLVLFLFRASHLIFSLIDHCIFCCSSRRKSINFAQNTFSGNKKWDVFYRSKDGEKNLSPLNIHRMSLNVFNFLDHYISLLRD